MTAGQLDFFQDDSQCEMFDENAAPTVYRADPDKVRADLDRIIAEARGAQVMPWPSARAKLYQATVPQMTLWLPEDEAAQLRFAFEREMARLRAA